MFVLLSLSLFLAKGAKECGSLRLHDADDLPFFALQADFAVALINAVANLKIAGLVPRDAVRPVAERRALMANRVG
jgi:hypothetical protein